MIQKKEVVLLGFMLTLLLVGMLMWAVQPAPNVQAQGGLPSRDTPVPERGGKEKSSGPLSTHIELYVSGAPAGAWSGVQWQNELGDWYDVEGWQGTLYSNGTRKWWVHEKDFGDGPFRWVITQGQGGPVLGTSESFNLPAGASETVRVIIALAK